MKRDSNAPLKLGEWTVAFSHKKAALDCKHRKSGCRVKGKLRFHARVGRQDVAWSIGPPLDGAKGRLSLLDPDGNCQGYVALDANGPRLRLYAIHRAAQSFQGALAFDAAASVGADTFACRTQAPARKKVVQMAAGPADSALNDSLFDVPTDTALVFSEADVAITTEPAGKSKKPKFHVRATARVHDSAQAAIAMTVERDYYRSRWAPWYSPVDKKRCPAPPTGWMSWNVYFDTAGERENLAEARVGARKLKPYGLEIWSIESWQDNSATLPVRDFHNLTLRALQEQFPSGMRWLAEEIRKLGFKPGIWTVPFGTGDEAYYALHKDWFLHHPDGAPMTNWCGRFVLDPSQPQVRAHMRETHRIMAEEWGYEFFKIDGMSGRGPGYSAHFYERPDVQAAFARKCAGPYERCVKALRKGIGPDRIFLACQGHYSGPDVAYADAGRIGADIVHPNQPPHWRNYYGQGLTTLNQLFANNILWYNDPDTLLVGEYAPLDVARLATTVVGLPGQMMFAGDKLAELPKERMWLLQRTLPVCDVRPLDLFPIHDALPVWTLKVARPWASWDVVSLFNWSDRRAKKLNVKFDELGLDAKAGYLVYDYWRQKCLGSASGKIQVELEPQSNALLAVHPALGRPQFLSTDRHLTQGAVSIETLEWDAAAAALFGRTQLVPGETTTITLHVPEGFALQSAAAGSATVKAKQHRDGTATVKLRTDEAGAVDWVARF